MAKKQFRDVPALPPEQLGKVAAALGRVPRMNRRAKTSLMQILIEAATADRADPDRTGTPSRAENIKTSAQVHTDRALGLVRRASEALMNISDAEWNQLVEDANRDKKD